MEVTFARSSALSLNSLVASAVSAGTPGGVAEEARRITAARFRVVSSDAAVSDRARSYYWGIVRRRALRGHAPALTESLLALSLASELAAAGHEPEAVKREVARLYGESRVPVIEPALGGGRAA